MTRRALAIFRNCFVTLVLSMAMATACAAEEDEFQAAMRAFTDGFHERAASELAEFRKNYPESTNSAPAAIYQAQAMHRMGNHGAVIELLTNLQAPPPLVDERLFWLAQAHLESGQNEKAASLIDQLFAERPQTPRKPAAIFAQALANFRQGNLTNVVTLLHGTNSVFSAATPPDADTNLLFRARLLLGQSFTRQTNHPAARATLSGMSNLVASPLLRWELTHALTELELQATNAATALSHATNLVGQAKALPDSGTQLTRSQRLLATVYERLNQPTQAASVLAEMAARPDLPMPDRRAAITVAADLLLSSGNLTNAVGLLAPFIQANAATPEVLPLRLKLADIYLDQFYAQRSAAAPVATLTNSLALVQQQLTPVLAQTNATLLANAQLKSGWTLWELSFVNRMPELLGQSLIAFRAAAAALPRSLDLAVATQKAGDCLFHAREWASALTNYNAVVGMFDLPGVRERFGGEALYQITRCHLELRNIQAADEVSARAVREFPQNMLASSARLLVVQALLSAGQQAEARSAVTNLIQIVPRSEILPEAQIALAQTYVEQRDWPAALHEYNTWLVQHTNHHLRAEVEFNRAWMTAQAGDVAAAMKLFGQFATNHPAHPLAPRAQMSMADHYFNQQQFGLAEQNYQRVFQNTNWSTSELTFDARFMAARSAFFREGFADAQKYLTELYQDKNCPTNLIPRVLFDLGEALLEQPNPTNQLAHFNQAIEPFRRITREFPTHALAGLAWGKIGDCYFQYATQADPNYLEATNAYHNVLAAVPAAPVAARCQAEFGLGMVKEKLAESLKLQGKPPSQQAALQQQALDHYLNVVYGRNLGETSPDPFWLRKAGLAAARLAESSGRTEQAIGLYRRLQDLLPSLEALWRSRLEALGAGTDNASGTPADAR